jgi:hypothetical protein
LSYSYSHASDMTLEVIHNNHKNSLILKHKYIYILVNLYILFEKEEP